MSFVFNWPRFSDQFHYDAIQMLNNALNKGKKPPVIADKIEVVELEMGTQPPELDVREIGELTMDQFRGIFRLTYSGDAHLVLKTKVQANPLNHKASDIHHLTGSVGMLAAKQPLVVPMLLRLSHFELASIVVLVVSKQKGITLVFKTDPLKRVDINSTFDSIAVIQKFIQTEIENQLKQMFREDLPGIIHRLSQSWVKAKVETPYLTKQPSNSYGTTRPSRDSVSLPPTPISSPPLGASRYRPSPLSANNPGTSRMYSASSAGGSLAGRTHARRTSASEPASPSGIDSDLPQNADFRPPTFPDLEEYDPTYGLRPEGVPNKSPFRGFGALFQPNRGLADLSEEPSKEDVDRDQDEYDDEVSSAVSFDVVDWNTKQSLLRSPLSPEVEDDHPDRERYEYEQIPAIGGGIITRPRVIHSQSVGQSPALSGVSSPGLGPGIASAVPFSPSRRPGSYSSPLTRASSMAHMPVRPSLVHQLSAQHNPYFSPNFRGSRSPLPYTPIPPRSAPIYNTEFVGSSPEDTESSLETPPSFHTSSTGKLTQPSDITTPPQSTAPLPSRTNRPRRSSLSSVSQDDSFDAGPRKIILRPSMLTLNNSIHQLSNLSHSNQTLSPYTRSVEHFTVRSGPPRPPKPPSRRDTPLPVKAKRKRTYKLGGQRREVPHLPPNEDEDELGYYSDSSVPHSPVPPSEFDAMDMAHYFRTTPSLRKRRS